MTDTTPLPPALAGLDVTVYMREALVPHIVFALSDSVAGSRRIVETIPYIRRHIRTHHGGVLEAEARDLFERFDPALLAYISNKEG